MGILSVIGVLFLGWCAIGVVVIIGEIVRAVIEGYKGDKTLKMRLEGLGLSDDEMRDAYKTINIDLKKAESSKPVRKIKLSYVPVLIYGYIAMLMTWPNTRYTIRKQLWRERMKIQSVIDETVFREYIAVKN